MLDAWGTTYVHCQHKLSCGSLAFLPSSRADTIFLRHLIIANWISAKGGLKDFGLPCCSISCKMKPTGRCEFESIELYAQFDALADENTVRNLKQLRK